jgi:hypothetical protein
VGDEASRIDSQQRFRRGFESRRQQSVVRLRASPLALLDGATDDYVERPSFEVSGHRQDVDLDESGPSRFGRKLNANVGEKPLLAKPRAQCEDLLRLWKIGKLRQNRLSVTPYLKARAATELRQSIARPQNESIEVRDENQVVDFSERVEQSARRYSVDGLRATKLFGCRALGTH